MKGAKYMNDQFIKGEAEMGKEKYREMIYLTSKTKQIATCSSNAIFLTIKSK